MKRFVLGMTALLCAVSVQSKKPLMSPEVDPSELDTLTEEDTSGLHQHVEGRAEGSELRTGYPLSALADTQCHDDFRCW